MTQYVWGNQNTQFFYHLGPEEVLQAIGQLGIKTTGRCLTLNSMENRVYEIEIDHPMDAVIENPSDHFIIAKFYRPGRWSYEQIKDEHQFLFDLQEADIPAIAPLPFEGETVFKDEKLGLFYSVFPKKGGRNPDEMNDEQLLIMGRLLARLHNVGASKKALHRLEINLDTFGSSNLSFLLNSKVIPPHLEPSYQSLVEGIIKKSAPLFQNLTIHRIHGDCHLGNIIWNPGEGPFFIDFDDMLNGPAIQDIWLVEGGRDPEGIRRRNVLIEGYEMMRDFNRSELKLIEVLRTLRYIHFSAWIAKRWEDPAFKAAFPHFDDHHYWDVAINDLREQSALIDQTLEVNPYY